MVAVDGVVRTPPAQRIGVGIATAARALNGAAPVDERAASAEPPTIVVVTRELERVPGADVPSLPPRARVAELASRLGRVVHTPFVLIHKLIGVGPT